MPIMNRMREGMPVILFGLLIIFLVTIVFEWGMDYLGMRGGTRSDVVGKVNGTKIMYREFSELLKLYSDNQKQQTGKEPDEEELKSIREQTWQTMVTQALVEEEIKRLGLTVTDQELVDWVKGPNPPDDLRRNFIDSTGQFRRDVYEQFLANPNQFLRDPNNRDAQYGSHWLAEFEKGLRQRRLNEKLQSLISATVRVSDGEVREKFAEQNQRASAEYALFDFATVPDGDVQVSDADLKSYYEENIDQYKFEASRKLKYVLFLEKPSASDTLMRKKDIEDAAARARSGMDFLSVIAQYADKPDSGTYYKHGELQPGIETPAFAAKVGDIVGPIEDAEGFHLLKVLDQRNASSEYVRASHVLIQVNYGGDTLAAKREADDVYRQAKNGGDFAELAKQHSTDPSSTQKGGDLGWFSRGRMVASFDNAVFKAKVGDVVGPIRTQFGWHVIKVTGRDNRELKVAALNLKIETSSQTKNDLFDRAKDFAFNSGKTELAHEAQQTGLDVRETQVQDKSTVVPGIGVNDLMTKWAFNAKQNAVSDPFTIPSGYVVATVAEIKAAGVRPFDEVKESLRPAVLRKKKLERAMQLASDARAKLGSDSLSKISQFAPTVHPQQTGEFLLGMAAPGIGRDPAFLGAVEVLQPGKISNPVQGQRGAYLICVTSRTPFDTAAFASQRESLQSRLLQEKKGRFINDWIAKLKEGAEIEDHRDQFFR
jgi:parvulin-like peptidyl-prolyl isomerase